MRRPVVPVAALLFALASGSAFAATEKAAPVKPSQPKSAATKPAATKPMAKDATAEASRSQSELKALGVPAVKESVLTPEQVKAQQAEWKKLEQQQMADRKVRREQFKGLMASYSKEGLDLKRGDKPNTYRLIAPAISQTTDPARRKAAAKALATRVKGQMEPILKKKITIEVYTDAKATQRITY